MPEGLIAAALLMGAAGVPHCTVMCAAPCTVAARACGAASTGWQAGAALQTGRLLGYALLGALAAASAGFGRFFAEHVTALRPLWQMLQVAVFVFGLWLLVSGRAPAWVLAGARGRQPHPASAAGAPSTLRAAPHLIAAGLAWALVPCVQLYAAVVLAALASSPAEGALLMVLFGLPGAAALAVGPSLWTAWKKGRPGPVPVALPGQVLRAAPSTWPVRAAGAALALSAAAWLAVSLVPLVRAWCA